MSDFTSEFWNWWIIVITVVGIIACFWLVWYMSSEKKQPGEDVETMGHVWDGDLEEYNNPLPGWWKNMFYITLVFGVGYLILYPGLGSFAGVLGWSQYGMHAEQVKEAEEEFGPIYAKYAKESLVALGSRPEAIKTGERMYLTYCTACHGSDAGGVKGFPNLRDADWLYGGDENAIKTSILDGRNGVMPAWEGPLGGEQGVHEVTQYVLSLSDRPNVDAQAAAAGKGKFMMFCTGCHLPDGKGMAMLGAPNLTDNIWLYGGHPDDVAQSIAKGRAGLMPAHREFLGEDKVHLIAAYIYNLSQ